MSKEEITKEILFILGNFKLSENIQIKELVALYMKKQEEIERLNNIIKEVREYINNGYLSDGEMVNMLAQQELLEILDKEMK